MANRNTAIFLMLVLGWSPAGLTLAADPENCLLCHRYRGLARIDTDTHKVRLYHVDPNYCDRALGPHAHLKCTDCHNH